MGDISQRIQKHAAREAAFLRRSWQEHHSSRIRCLRVTPDPQSELPWCIGSWCVLRSSTTLRGYARSLPFFFAFETGTLFATVSANLLVQEMLPPNLARSSFGIACVLPG